MTSRTDGDQRSTDRSTGAEGTGVGDDSDLEPQRGRRRLELFAAVLFGAIVLVVVVWFSAQFMCRSCACSVSPNVGIATDYHPGNATLVVTHERGDQVHARNTGQSYVEYVDRSGTGRHRVWFDGTSTESVTAGDQLIVEDVRPGSTVKIVWVGPDGDLTRTFYEETVEEGMR